MSATLGGLSTLERWLDKTEIYTSDHRPVPLSEYTLDSRSAKLSLEPELRSRKKFALSDIAKAAQ